MKTCILYFVVVCTVLPLIIQAALEYNKPGDFIIGAILPLSKDSVNGKCTAINAEGNINIVMS